MTGVEVAILAGGAATRMGADKPAQLLAGRRLIDWVAAAVREAGLSATVLADHDYGTGFDCLRDADRDRGPEGGGRRGGPGRALAGLARRGAGGGAPGRYTSAVLAIGADQPLVRPELLAHLASFSASYPASFPDPFTASRAARREPGQRGSRAADLDPGAPADVVLPMIDGQAQMTCALYSPAAIAWLDECSVERHRGLALRAVLDCQELKVLRLGGDELQAACGEDGRSFWSIDTPQQLREAETWLSGAEGRRPWATFPPLSPPPSSG